jgi:GDPmannose 4,6-dehydratase
MIMSQPVSGDYIIATGKLHSVREFAETVFKILDLDLEKYLRVNTKYFRASEHKPLCGDASKLRSIGWTPTKSLTEIIELMIDGELAFQAQK